MDVDSEKVKQFKAASIALKCDNCSSWLQNNLESEEVTKVKSGSTILDTEVQIWNALAFIYGVSWTSIQNYVSVKRTQFLKTQDELRFCRNCTSLLNDNYNSHLKFENSSDSSSVVQILKEFRDYQMNLADKQVEVQFLPHDLAEEDIKVDVCEDFVTEDSDDDPFQSEDPIETKYEPPSTFIENATDGNSYLINSERVQFASPRMLRPRSNRQLVIKSEKLSAEEILQFSNKTNAKKKRTSPRTRKQANASKSLGNDERVKNKDTHFKQVTILEQKPPKSPQNRSKRKKVFVKKETVTKLNPASPFEEKVKLVMERFKDKSKCEKVVVNRRFICIVCGKHFKDFSHLRYKHWPFHLENSTRTCVCDICGKPLKTRNYVKWHIIRNHATEEEQKKWKTKCNLCDADMFSFDVANHMHKIHKDHPQETCNQCGKVFINKIRLKAHLIVHSNTSEKCDLCDKVFTATKYLEKHKITMHSNKERKFCCHVCPQKFYTKRDMDRHRVTHSDLRQYICEECGKTFKHISYFQEHLKCHREVAETGGWTYECNLCEGKKFKHSVGLKEHMKRIHRTGNRKIYECSVCAKQLSSLTILRTHENMHKQVPGFTPRVRNKLPDYIKGQVSELPHQPLAASEAVDNN